MSTVYTVFFGAFSVSPCFTVELGPCMLHANQSKASDARLPFCAPSLLSCFRKVAMLTVPPHAGGELHQSESLQAFARVPCSLRNIQQQLACQQAKLLAFHPIVWSNRMLPQWFSFVCLSAIPHTYRDSATWSRMPLASLQGKLTVITAQLGNKAAYRCFKSATAT